MAGPNFSITDVVGRGVNFHKANWRRVLGVLTLAAAAGTLNFGGGYAGNAGLERAGGLANFVVSIMATGALLRLAFQQDQPARADLQIGHSGVQWRGPEWRLLGVFLVMIFVFFLVALIVVFSLVFLGLVLGLSGAMAGLSDGASPEEVAQAVGPGATLPLALLMLAFAFAVLWLAVRLLLANPATVAEGRVRVFETFALTRGRFWKLLGALLLASLPTIVVSIVVSGIVQAVGEPVTEDGPRFVELPLALLLGAVTAVVAAFVQLPLSAGVYAELYRRLGPSVPAQPATLTPASSPAP